MQLTFYGPVINSENCKSLFRDYMYVFLRFDFFDFNEVKKQF